MKQLKQINVSASFTLVSSQSKFQKQLESLGLVSMLLNIIELDFFSFFLDQTIVNILVLSICFMYLINYFFQNQVKFLIFCLMISLLNRN
jgi:hypothetical protein